MKAFYDEIAGWYDGTLGGGLPLGGPALLELIGDVAGRRICDLGCGQGVIARRLALRGASVVGVDLSSRLLEIARRHELDEPLGILYLRADAQDLAALRDATCDGVVCSLALMDIPDLRAVVATVRRILRPSAWFAFSITHPCFQTPAAQWLRQPDGSVSREIRGYLTEGFWRSDNPDGVRGKVGAYHRTLSTYLNALIDEGLLMERVIEPAEAPPEVERPAASLGVPKILAVRCRKHPLPT